MIIFLLLQTEIVREPNSENCLDLIFVPFLCEKVFNVPDTNYTISAIRKFMLDMPSPGSFQDISLKSEPIGLRAGESMRLT